MFQAQGKYSEAEGLFKRALAIREKALGASHSDVGESLNNLATRLSRPRPVRGGGRLLKRALVIREKALGASHPDVGETLNNLANVYQDQGKYSEAEGLYKRALAIREKALGASHPDVGQTLNNLADLYRTKANMGGGGALQARVGDPRKSARCEPPRRGPDLNNLALVYRAQGKYSEAEGLFKRALAIREKALGASHPTWAKPSLTSRIVYRDQGKYGEAEGLFKRALAITEKAIGANHPDVAWTLNNLACFIRAKANTARRRRSTSARWPSERKRSVRTTPAWAKASTTWPSCIEPRQVQRGGGALQARVGDPGTGSWCRATPTWARPQQPGPRVSRPGQVHGGGGALQRALAIREKALGASHPDVGQSLNNLANVYRAQGKYAGGGSGSSSAP